MADLFWGNLMITKEDMMRRKPGNRHIVDYVDLPLDKQVCKDRFILSDVIILEVWDADHSFNELEHVCIKGEYYAITNVINYPEINVRDLLLVPTAWLRRPQK